MTSPQDGSLARLTDSLSQWRVAQQRDIAYALQGRSSLVAAAEMATAIEQFLTENEQSQQARHRALNPSDTLLQALEARHQQRLEWQAMREKVK